MPRPALIVLACAAALAACQKQPKPIAAPELEPMLASQLPMSQALDMYAVREDLKIRLGGQEDFQALVATSSRYSEQGVPPGETAALKAEVKVLADRYFEMLAADIEKARTWPSGDQALWRQRARLALASAERDFAYQFASGGDLGGALRGTDKLRAWMKGEARPIFGPRPDWASEQMTAMAGLAPPQPQRPAAGETLSSGPPTALAIPAPSSQ